MSRLSSLALTWVLLFLFSCRGKVYSSLKKDSCHYISLQIVNKCNGDTLGYPEINIYRKPFNGKENLYFYHVFQDSETLKPLSIDGKYDLDMLRKEQVVYVRASDINLNVNVPSIPIFTHNMTKDTVIEYPCLRSSSGSYQNR